MIYKWVKALGRFFIRYHSLGIIFAVILTAFNSIFVDFKTGSISFRIVLAPAAIVNYVLFVFVFVFWVAQMYGVSKRKLEGTSKRRELFDAFCEQVFTALSLDYRFRVSFFEERNGYLDVTGRFAQFRCEPVTKVRFKSDMGCVGIAYNTGSMNVIDNLPDFATNSEEYYRIMKKSGSMNREDVDRLNWKNRSYLSYPIKYFNSQKIAAVLCIDCVDSDQFSSDSAKGVRKSINRIISPLISTLFRNELVNNS